MPGSAGRESARCASRNLTARGSSWSWGAASWAAAGAPAATAAAAASAPSARARTKLRMRLPSSPAARGPEDPRVGDDRDPAPLGLRELPALDPVHHAALDPV